MQKGDAMGWGWGMSGAGGSSVSFTPCLLSSPEEGQTVTFQNGWVSPLPRLFNWRENMAQLGQDTEKAGLAEPPPAPIHAEVCSLWVQRIGWGWGKIKFVKRKKPTGQLNIPTGASRSGDTNSSSAC